ncbi:unnamed protein product [Caretta caretta]
MLAKITKEFNKRDTINQLGETKKFLVCCRSDADFEKTLVDADELAEELDVPALLNQIQSVLEKRGSSSHMKQMTNLFIIRKKNSK